MRPVYATGKKEHKYYTGNKNQYYGFDHPHDIFIMVCLTCKGIRLVPLQVKHFQSLIAYKTTAI